MVTTFRSVFFLAVGLATAPSLALSDTNAGPNGAPTAIGRHLANGWNLVASYRHTSLPLSDRTQAIAGFAIGSLGGLLAGGRKRPAGKGRQ